MERTPTDLSEQEQKRVLRKVTLRLIPLLFLCYIVAYIDRINVGYAKAPLQEVFRIDPERAGAVFGLGAGLFFIGYFLFEVPSNFMLHRVGAKFWIARIMVMWGLVSMGFMWVESTGWFYAMRFLLGAAEAGFFPGVILYLTYWYPAAERAKTIAWFTLGGVAAGVIGSPLCGALLSMHGKGGLAGYQWMFLLEAIPAILLGGVVLWYLPNGPRQAKWLKPYEQEWLVETIERENREAGPRASAKLGQLLKSKMVWIFCLMYFLVNVGGYGFEMWLPTIVKGISGSSDWVVGWLNAIPYAVAGVAMVLVGRFSDRRGVRSKPLFFSALAAMAGFLWAGWMASWHPVWAMAGLCVAFAGQKSTLGPFWAMVTSLLRGGAAVGGIAVINSVGNLGGFAGPYLVGWIRDTAEGSGDFAALAVLGGSLLLMALLALRYREGRGEAAQ